MFKSNQSLPKSLTFLCTYVCVCVWYCWLDQSIIMDQSVVVVVVLGTHLPPPWQQIIYLFLKIDGWIFLCADCRCRVCWVGGRSPEQFVSYRACNDVIITSMEFNVRECIYIWHLILPLWSWSKFVTTFRRVERGESCCSLVFVFAYGIWLLRIFFFVVVGSELHLSLFITLWHPFCKE